jgi:putative peptidoglycan lipid II flippase
MMKSPMTENHQPSEPGPKRKTLSARFSSVLSWADTPTKTIGGAALIIAASGIVSRLLGFLRDHLLAARFGAGDTLDAYYAAFQIPDFFYSLIVLGALSAAFIPVFTDLIEKDRRDAAWKLVSELLKSLFVLLSVVAVLGAVFAPQLVGFLAPGFGDEKLALTVSLMRIMLLGPIFLGMSSVFGGVLVSFRQFVANAFAPVVYNLGIIGGILFFVPTMGVTGLAWGVIIGALAHALIQYPAFVRSGFGRHRLLRMPWHDENVRRVLWLMIPRTLGMAINQITAVIESQFASLLSSGSIAVLRLSNNIQSVPLGLFGIPFSLAAFPSLSIFAAQEKEKEFFEALSSTTRRILFFVVPISLFLIIFRAQFVRVILGSGQFDWNDTILTFGMLKWFAMSLFAQSLIPLFARAFFALQDTRTPFYISLTSAMVQVVLIPVLLPYYSVEALALAFSAGTIVNISLLYWFLRKRLTGEWNDRAFILPIFKAVLAALIAGVAAQVSKSVFALTITELDTTVKVLSQLLFGLSIGGAVFLGMAAWLRLEDFVAFKQFIWRKIFRNPVALSEAGDHPESGEW